MEDLADGLRRGPSILGSALPEGRKGQA